MNIVAQLNTALAGRYDIEREVGAGGMATVYVARDLKHNRRVALKVLRPDLGAVLGVERFLSEIQVTANLQHPNLLPLFDSGEAGGQLFYVMPFIEGESLRAKLDREKQLPIDDAIHIATSVASALDYAHRRGVIHRDLKPENILLHEGQPLVADFGIALAVSNAGGGRITQTGLSLGTPQYMSPEQATGDRAIDARTDIYSLGALTYEMLTGDPPHVGSTSQAIIARVLTEKPRGIRSSRPNVPEHVEVAVEHALEKLPADRFASAHEFADALTGKAIVARSATAARTVETAAATSRTRRTRFVVASAGVLWAASLFAATMLGREEQPDAPEMRFEVETPMGRTTTVGAAPWVSISPDGRTVLYVAEGAGSERRIWVRPIGATVAQPLAGTEGANVPFWSPDSRFVGFSADQKLKKVAVAGGPPFTICDVVGFGGGAWNADDVIVFASARKLYRVSAAGGAPVGIVLRDADTTLSAFRAPEFLPDGRRFLFTYVSQDAVRRGIYIGSLDGRTFEQVNDVPSNAKYAPSGHIVFQREGTLFAQRFDAERGRVSGEPARIAENITFNAVIGSGLFEVSTTGVLVYRPAMAARDSSELRWFSRDGTPAGRAGEPGPFSVLRLSPDDKRVAVLRNDVRVGRVDVYTLDLTSQILSRLTLDSTRAADPVWTHDSRAVAYASLRSGGKGFFMKTVGGAQDTALIASVAAADWPDDFSADGQFFLYHNTNGLYAMPLTGPRTPRALTTTPFTKDEPRFSPDGKWIAYGTIETGAWEVNVATFPEFTNIQQVSAKGGAQVRWRADGKELFYLAPDGMVMSVPIRTAGASTEFLAPVQLFQGPLTLPVANISQWGVTRDGRRFLFLVPPGAQENRVAPAMVVVNWTSGLPK